MKLKALILIFAFLLAACTMARFPDKTFSTPNYSKSLANSSRITVSSRTDSWGGTKNYAWGNLYIDGIYKGGFTESNPIFSQEIQSGQHLIEACQPSGLPGDSKWACVKVEIMLQPNTHIYYEYLMQAANHRLRFLKIESYPDPIIDTSKSNTIDKTALPSKSPKNQGLVPNKNITDLENAKKKCIELGFKVGTDTFGNCMLRIAN